MVLDVPDVAGITQNSAEAAIIAAGLNVGTITASGHISCVPPDLGLN